MNTGSRDLIARVWSYAQVHRDDGLGYSDFLQKISCLIFLKMEGERETLLGEISRVPKPWNWATLRELTGDRLWRYYLELVDALSIERGLPGTIFGKSDGAVQDPVKLSRLIALIDGETWLALDVDVKSALYEGLLERYVSETRGGAGQYFTPRPLTRAVVDVMRPEPGEAVHDPACGTGGFLIAAFDYMKTRTLDKESLYRLAREEISGTDIVADIVRLCTMNLYLHGIGGRTSPITHGDALAVDPGRRYSTILTNPPFGRRSSYRTMSGDILVRDESRNYNRSDFRISSSNKQIGYLQHVMTILDVPGRAAVVVPDSLLFERGAGEKIRHRLLESFDLHTILRLPTGIFLRPDIKANVLFFDSRPGRAKAWTKAVWVYDNRTAQHYSRRDNPLREKDFQSFIEAYNPDDRQNRSETDRFRCFTHEQVMSRENINLDFSWQPLAVARETILQPVPGDIAAEIVRSLDLASKNFRSLARDLRHSDT